MGSTPENSLGLAGLALLALVLLAGCAGGSSGGAIHILRGDTPDSTLYLGQDGKIIGDSRILKRLIKAGAQFDSPNPHPAAAPAPQPSYWKDEGGGGSPSITIDLSEQHALFYKGSRLVGMSPISTGREGYATPTGNFSIVQRDRDHLSTLYGDYVDAAGAVVVANIDVNKDRRPPGTHFRGAPMPYFMRITGGVGLHAGYLPGYPASHGCIRMPKDMAEIFFSHAPEGTPVRVVH